MIHENGWEYHHIAAAHPVELSKFFEAVGRMGEMEIILKKQFHGDFAQNMFAVSLAELFRKLTEKQRRALVDAIENGYYSVPRHTTVGDLARAKGVPRTTFEEHLHKAESKVIQSVGTYLRLYDTS
jgi:predicted DNA binding protein